MVILSQAIGHSSGLYRRRLWEEFSSWYLVCGEGTYRRFGDRTTEMQESITTEVLQVTLSLHPGRWPSRGSFHRTAIFGDLKAKDSYHCKADIDKQSLGNCTGWIAVVVLDIAFYWPVYWRRAYWRPSSGKASCLVLSYSGASSRLRRCAFRLPPGESPIGLSPPRCAWRP